ncbi:Alpha carbonic anhydrase 1, chloroplastic [Cucurbita argyrosperma subsp. argyrosperma]|uniref:Carbonic anhydrase n=1 Tax=Cucurbita moschata TaxID=3662 RepID=A0A6J1F2T4_CUCMO|nr:alpha carbonic anhydrase 1, chloroplastic-like [Cucurbita moschata]KAG7017460.1 Alpha carbonic anhydrase 1, chloroplastic [Cucurbita argyrosperma subsp. argyrosperma]
MAPSVSSIFVLSLLLIGVFVQTHAKNEQSVTFSYEGSSGPEHWGSMSSKFATCSKGKSQSPIDIVKDGAVFGKHLQKLVRRYSTANATLVNNGFNIGVDFGEKTGGVAVIDEKNYTLRQMHWHSPSEHLLNGKRFAAELHLIHKSDDGGLSVIAILLQDGDSDPLLEKIQGKLRELTKEKCGSNEEAHIALGELNLKHLRKKTRKYYRYIGSFTVPPCTENVVWTILGKVRTISKKQVEALKAPLEPPYKKNARPAQPLNGRKIEIYDELSEY